jgi:hypothetical protein
VGKECIGREARMRGLYIIGEGPTEEQFVNEVLRKYFLENEIYDVRCILMRTSPGHKGGAVSFGRLKRNIEKLLNHEDDIIVTSLIDFFRMKSDFPKYQQAQNRHPNDKVQRVNFLEAAIDENINHPRFIPYIQLHEFESLLFASNEGFDFIPDISDSKRALLALAVQEYDNPELLNDGASTAPSKRLELLIPGYQKTFHGPLIADIVTIEKMLERCTRFRSWIQTLIRRMQH